MKQFSCPCIIARTFTFSYPGFGQTQTKAPRNFKKIEEERNIQQVQAGLISTGRPVSGVANGFLSLPRIFRIVMIILVTTCAGTYTYGQRGNDSAKKVLHNLDIAFKNNEVPEKQYLDSINVLMNYFFAVDIPFTNRELLQVLQSYRTVIWSGKTDNKYKRTYFGILSNNAQMAGRGGEMLYYAKKLNDLEQQETKLPSITALTITADYYNTANAYDKTCALYKEHKAFLQSIPHSARTGAIDVVMIIQSGILLNQMAAALYNTGDTTNGIEVEHTINSLADLVKSKYSNDSEAIAYFGYIQALVLYERGRMTHALSVQQQSFRKMEQLLLDDKTPRNLKYYIEFTTIDHKLAFFLKAKNNDSTTFYLDQFEEAHRKEAVSYNLYTIYKYKGLALYNKGQYQASADTLQTAIKILDSSRSIITKDINDMMYARAEADEKDIVLAAAAQKQAFTEKKLQAIFIGSAFIIILALALTLYFRQRQKTSFLQFKLNIARNLHDETGPALLYAKALAKATRPAEDSDTRTILEQHIEHTMQAIRSLSHDLKSERLKTIGDLVNEISVTLKKLNIDNSFSSNVMMKADGSRLLSHYQFSNLKSVILEVITNTIKHATFSSIDIEVHIHNNKLNIIYRDNGNGWDSRTITPGIGLQNIQERIKNLNGDFVIRNNYPEGYQINMEIRLS